MKTYQLISLTPLARVAGHPDPAKGYPAKLTLPDDRTPPEVDADYKYVIVLAAPFYNSNTHRISKSLSTEADGWLVTPLTQEELDAKIVLPPAPVPITIKAWQAKAALEQAGLFVQAGEAIAAMADGPEKVVTLSAWNNNADFSRDSPTIAAIGSYLGLNSEQLDDLFELGATFDL